MKNLKLNNELAKIKERLDILEKSNKRLSDELLLIKNPYKYEERQNVICENNIVTIIGRQLEIKIDKLENIEVKKLYWIMELTGMNNEPYCVEEDKLELL